MEEGGHELMREIGTCRVSRRKFPRQCAAHAIIHGGKVRRRLGWQHRRLSQLRRDQRTRVLGGEWRPPCQ